MSTASLRTIRVLEHLVKDLPVGTNLALLQLLWALLSGTFLTSRGALFPALLLLGLTAVQLRRVGQALRQGAWANDTLVQRWRMCIAEENLWQPNSYEGYQPLAGDVTCFWRPRLRGWTSKFFCRLADRAMKGIAFGLLVQVGHVAQQRLPILRAVLSAAADTDECQFKQQVLRAAAQALEDQQVLVYDAGASVSDLQAAQVARYVVRLRRNATARRNVTAAATKPVGRRRVYGALVRPLPRQHKGHDIAATSPDIETAFVYDERTVQAQGWQDLVSSDQKAGQPASFTIWLFRDPAYPDPLLLATNVRATAQTILCLYVDRWSVEEVPLVCKQLLGLQRQFVSADAARYRLPALGLLAANILAYLAAVLPPLPTGFWDRRPQRTAGRLRRVLARDGFPNHYPFDGRLRKKQAHTSHLPKGTAAHRRHRAAVLTQSTA